MDQSEENLKKMDQSDWTRLDGLKCYTNETQWKRSNKKCYTSTFRFYIDIDV